ncbi:MAG TPA: YhjD/YihY/BrkB family envelope integrity protein [Candidatus Limnocylindria bacterium]|nr:YhjD/YihY/BrkB family envelope integrity protein [Candidatus Limnocylindria bacterium]
MATDVSAGVSPDVSAWKLGGLSVKELARRVWSEFWEDEVTDRAAALAYYFVFALFPALLFLTSLLGLLPIPGLMDRLLEYMSRALPGDAASVLQKTLTEVITGAKTSLLSFGALAALWAGSNGMASIMTALNIVYDAEESRPFWKRKLLALGLTFGFALFILTALVLMVFGPKLGAMVAGWVGLGQVFEIAWNIISIPLVMSLVAVGIALVYYFAPNVEQKWQWVTPGSVVALVIWLAMSAGLRYYVSNFGNYNATYGSIGGVILLMLWLYLSGVVLLLGAEVNSEIEHAAAARGDATAKLPGEKEAPAPEGKPGEVRRGNVLQLRPRVPVMPMTAEVGHLVRLRVEMAVAEAKGALVAAGVSVAVAMASVIVLVTAITVLVAGALAPLFEGPWQPLVTVGGGALLLGAGGLAWSVRRLRGLGDVPKRTMDSIKEDWRWLGTRLRSGLTSR